MRISKRILSVILSMVLLISAVSFSDMHIFAESFTDEGIAKSTNIYSNFYAFGRFGSTVKSYLYAQPDGGYMRAEYIDGTIYIEKYTSGFQFVSSGKIQPELPVYGGIYCGNQYNFIVTGRNNPEDNPNVEVMRITKYSKNWEKISSASIIGANTYEPFNVGAVRFVESGKYLYVYTAHTMFTYTDGLHHQANMSIVLDTEKMAVTHNNYGISDTGTGYLSHSFNQFIAVDKSTNSIITADHGDAHPRGIVVFKYSGALGTDKLLRPSHVEAFHFAGEDGDNDTYTSMGGIVVSDNNYLTVFSAADQSGSNLSEKARNIYVSVTPKNRFTTAGTKLIRLTDYTDKNVQSADTPHVTDIGNNRYLIMWNNAKTGYGYLLTYADTVSYVIIDENGNKLSDIYTSTAALSDCEPILNGNKVIWYTTGNSAPVFFSIDLSGPSKINIERCPHIFNEKIYSKQSCEADGLAYYTCKFCSYQYTKKEPSFNHTDKDRDGRCDTCDNFIPTENNTATAEWDKDYYLPGTLTAKLTIHSPSDAAIRNISTSVRPYSYKGKGNTVNFDIQYYDEGIYNFYIKLSDGEVLTARLVISEDGNIPGIIETPTVTPSTEPTEAPTSSTPTEPPTFPTPTEFPTITTPEEPTAPDPTEPTTEKSEPSTEPSTEQSTDASSSPAPSADPTSNAPSSSDMSTEPSTEKKQYKKGDLNNDGRITSADARIALRIAAKLQTANEMQLIAGNVNGDDKITASDARIILRVAAQLESFS